MVTMAVGSRATEVSDLGLKRLAQRKLRQVLELLDRDSAELGSAFDLVGEAEVAIDQLLQRREVNDG
jgi:hypothetical protein